MRSPRSRNEPRPDWRPAVTASVAYCPNYCEENVWQLCGELPEGTREAFAVFISNPLKAVALWSQRSAVTPGRPVIWDYHVVLLARSGSGWTVYDPDCTEPSPMSAASWIAATFCELPEDSAALAPEFRLVLAEQYRRELRSDRSHMLRGDRWASPPPPWPCIGEGTNLMEFVDTRSDFLGERFDLDGLRNLAGS